MGIDAVIEIVEDARAGKEEGVLAVEVDKSQQPPQNAPHKQGVPAC